MSKIVTITLNPSIDKTAGIVLSLSNNKTMQEAVRYGVACGGAATLNPGTSLCKKEDADALYIMVENQIRSIQ